MTAALIFFITKVLCPARQLIWANLTGHTAAHRPSIKESTLLDPLARVRHSPTLRSRTGRELIIVSGALIAGFVLIPLAIWIVGNRVLGPYTHGTNTHAGPMALLGDFFTGLAHGGSSYWIVALGPLLIILFARGAWALLTLKRVPDEQRPVKSNQRIEPTVSKDRL